MRKILAFLVLLTFLPLTLRGQALAEWYYWFDTDKTPRESGKVFGDIVRLQVDVSRLDMGAHMLYFQIVDTEGTYSSPVSKLFVHIPEISNFSKLYYILGGENKIHSTDFGDGTFSLDVSNCPIGLNTINLQVMDKQGALSSIMPYVFIKIPQTENAEDMTLICLIDGKMISEEKIATNGGTMKCSIDVSKLGTGLHKASFQLFTSSGACTSFAESYFLRTLTNDEIASMQCSYEIDGYRHYLQKGICTNGAFHFELPVDELEDGLHLINFMLTAENGTSTTQGSEWFFKIPVGGNAITQYDYWLNDNYNEVHSVLLDQPLNPYSLVDMLPVESVPLRSSCFQFETKEGKTMMYAKNIFHIAFYDVLGKRVEESRAFVDYNVSKEIRDISDLLSSQTFSLGNDNDVKWFKFEAERGDVLSFKTSQTCSIQLFSAEAKELYSVVFDKASVWKDYQTLENGVHYLAVHDISNPKNNITLNFNHLDYSDIYITKETVLGQENIDSDSVYHRKPSMMLRYDSDNTSVRGHLTVENGTTLSLGKYVQTGCRGHNNSNKYTKNGVEYYHPTTLVNEGFMRADKVSVKERFYRDQWHFISLPFNVRMSDIKMQIGTYYAIREYDGEQRAGGNGNNVWKDIDANGMLEANKGYILQLTSEFNDKSVELTFPAINDTKKNGIFDSGDSETALNEYPAEFPHNRGWNLIGNPYPCFFDTRFIDMTGTITVWNGSGYSAYSLLDDQYILMPFESFFVQKPIGVDNMVFRAEGRQHTDVKRALPFKSEMLRVAPASNRCIYNLYLSNEEYTDYSRIVLNDEASLDYESDKDAVKFMEDQPIIPQLYSKENGVRYAINERPTNDGIVVLSVCLPKDGMYSIGLMGEKAEAVLIDNENNTRIPIHEGHYSFHALKGTYEDRFSIVFNDSPTSVTRVSDTDDGSIHIIDHTLSFNFIHHCDVRVYGIDGILHYNRTTRSDFIQLNTGVYIIKVNGKATKFAIN